MEFKMLKNILACAAVAAAIPFSAPAFADDAQFLQSLSGNWTGGGPVRLSPDSSPVNVSCRFDGTGGAQDLALEGSCRGMVLFSREVGARIELRNGTYVGSYVGSERGTASLAGTRNGSSLDFELQWPDYPPATLTLSKPEEGRMVLTTVEEHPETGEGVVTAELQLERQ